MTAVSCAVFVDSLIIQKFPQFFTPVFKPTFFAQNLSTVDFFYFLRTHSPNSYCRSRARSQTYSTAQARGTLHTFELVERELLVQAEVWVVDDVVEHLPGGAGVGVEQRLCRDAVRQHEDNAQQYEEHQIGHLQNTASKQRVSET